MVPLLESQHSNLRHGDGPLALAQASYLLLVVVVVDVVCALLAAIVAVLGVGLWVVKELGVWWLWLLELGTRCGMGRRLERWVPVVLGCLGLHRGQGPERVIARPRRW
jgi:hypothetical protein